MAYMSGKEILFSPIITVTGESAEEMPLLISLIDGSIEEIAIPDGVDCIRNNAFNGCSNLTSVTMPDSVISVGEAAFQDCSNLASVTFGEGINNICAAAFSKCTQCNIYDFSRAVSVPSLASNLAVNDNTKIIVPSELYNEWVTAKVWANLADYIVTPKALPNEANFNIYTNASTLKMIASIAGTGIGKTEILNEGNFSYLRIYGDGSSQEAYAQIKNIEGRNTGRYLVFAYRLPTSNTELHNFFQIYANTTNERPTGNGDLINIRTNKDGKWRIVAIDIMEAIANQKRVVSGECSSQFVPNADGTYTIERLRIDFFNELTSTGSYVDVAYVGTCDSLELARGADADYTGAEIDTAFFISRLGTKATLNVHNNMPYVTITDTTFSSGEKYIELHNEDSVLANTSGYVGILYRASNLGGTYGQIYIGSSDNTYNYSGSITYNGDNNWNFGIIEIDRNRYKDSVCRKLRFDYFNGLAANTQYAIDVAFIKFFASEAEANAFYQDYATRYNL